MQKMARILRVSSFSGRLRGSSLSRTCEVGDSVGCQIKQTAQPVEVVTPTAVLREASPSVLDIVSYTPKFILIGSGGVE